MDDKIQFLKKTEIFRSLEQDDLKMVAEHLRERSYTPGDIIFTKFDQANELFIVKSGILKANVAGELLREFKTFDTFGELAIINKSLRKGTVEAVTDVLLYTLSENVIIEDQHLPAEVRIKIVIALARQVANYLSPNIYRETDTILNGGESGMIEYKSTLRYNLFTKKFGKEIEHAVLKTIAAFLNSKGGTLLIGVDDQGEPLGLAEDNFENHDKALLYLTNLVKERIGMQYLKFIQAYLEEVQGKVIMRVDVAHSSTPAYVSYNQEEFFYIRTGPATNELRVSEIYDYINNHFYKTSP